MREIKFRVWCKDRNEWEEDASFLNQDGELLYVGGSLDGRQLVPYKPENHIAVFYTGLKDKNGKKIWEGDIIKKPITINQEYHGEYCYEEIIKKQGQWLTSHIASEKGKLPRGYLRGFLLDSFDYDGKLFMWGEDYSPETEIEVIGNIYENKELLST